MRNLTLIFIMVLILTTRLFGQNESSCVTCHETLKKELKVPVEEWKKSVHKEKAQCHDCHGGNPGESSKELAMAGVRHLEAWDVPPLCAKCHSDPSMKRLYDLDFGQLDQYKTSVHGKRVLTEHDSNAAVCTSCHGKHQILSHKDPGSTVYRTKVPETCARCHSDEKLMAKYKIPTNQYEEYKESIHGIKLLKENQMGAPQCADCHGVHGATPPGVHEIPLVCGTCHGQTEKLFFEGSHGKSVREMGEPQCVSCHNNHKIAKSSDEMFLPASGICGTCHAEGGVELKMAGDFHKIFSNTSVLISQCGKKLDYLDSRSIYTTDLKGKLENSNTSITEARAIQHQMSLKNLQSVLGPGNDNAKSILKECDNRLKESLRRKQILFGVAFFLLFLSFLVMIKRNTLVEE